MSGPRVAVPDLPPSSDWWYACFMEGDAARDRGLPAPVVVPLIVSDRAALSLFGSSRAALPEAAVEGRCALIFEGSLDNRADLERGMTGDGDGPPAPDTAAFLLRAYLTHGEALLPRLRGQFALIVWDGRSDLLLCVRDPVGEWPLFYSHCGHRTIVSSSQEGVFRCPGISRALNRPALMEHLLYQPLPIDETFYARISRLPGGHVLRYDACGWQSQRYWNPLRASGIQWTGEEAADGFDRVLCQAVSRCLSAGEAGVYLSSGLDSAVVAVESARLSARSGQRPPCALSIVFPGPGCSEEEGQRNVARHLGLPHIVLSLDEASGSGGAVEAALEWSSSWPEPVSVFWWPAYGRLGVEAKDRGCSVLMTGEGGDEWLSPTHQIASDLLYSGGFRRLYRLWKAQTTYCPAARSAITSNIFWKSSARHLLGRLGRQALERRFPSFVEARDRRRAIAEIPAWAAPDPELHRQIVDRALSRDGGPAPGRFYEHHTRQFLDSSLVSRKFEQFHELGNRIGLSMRAPFWDADVIEHLAGTDYETRNLKGQSKGLARRLLAHRHSDLKVETNGLDLLPNLWASTVHVKGPPAWKRKGGARGLSDLGLVDRKRLDEVVAEPGGMDMIWDLLSADVWIRSQGER